MKFKGGELKYLLKRAARDVVPEDVINRKDKMGFPVPLHLWMKDRTRDMVTDTLLSSRARERGIFDTKEIEKLLDQRRRVRAPRVGRTRPLNVVPAVHRPELTGSITLREND